MIQNKFAAIEGLNNTLTLCAVLKVGNLGKKVMLNLENEGKDIRKCDINMLI